MSTAPDPVLSAVAALRALLGAPGRTTRAKVRPMLAMWSGYAALTPGQVEQAITTYLNGS